MRAVLLVLLAACAPVRPDVGAPACVEHGRDGVRSLWIDNDCDGAIVCAVEGEDGAWGPVEIPAGVRWATAPTRPVLGEYDGDCETPEGPVAWVWLAP